MRFWASAPPLFSVPAVVSSISPGLERDGLVYSQRTSGRFVTEDETMIQQAKRGLAERHIKTFVAAMVRLGFRREEMIALLRQETGEENDHGSFDL